MESQFIKIKTKQKWKKVEVNADEFRDEFFGFSGIEELTDYEIVREKAEKHSAESTGPKPTLRAGKKRKFEPDVVDEEATTKKKKPNQNAKKSSKKSKTKQKIPDKKHKSYDKPNGIAENVQTETSVEEYQQTVDGWTNLFVPEPILRALSDKGFYRPTAIQAECLPAAIRDRRDILGAAETGSGKTLAFGIPILSHILEDKAKEASDEDYEATEEATIKTPRTNKLRCLIVTPTRELAIQVKDHLVAAAKYTDIKVAVVLGGLAPQKQERILKHRPDIIVGTPGRLWELIHEGEAHLSTVSFIKYFVIDEADRMLEKGHFDELERILALINDNETAKLKRQTFVFSATLTLVHSIPLRFVNKRKKVKLTPKTKLENFMKEIGMREKPKIVDITRTSGTAEMLTEAKIHCKYDEKDEYLYYFLTQYPGRTLVFCNSIDCVRRLNNILTFLQCNPLPLHASMHQKQRLKNLERFVADENALLIASDVAARGLDIPDVQHVIHYQVPRTSEAYVHRSGRTARATKEGLSIMLIESKEMAYYRKIYRTLNRESDLPNFPIDTQILKEVKARIRLALRLDQLEHRLRKVSNKNSWFRRAAEDMEIVLDEDELLEDEDEWENAEAKREMKALQSEIKARLKKPVFNRKLTRFPTSSGNVMKMLTETINKEAIELVKEERNVQKDLMPLVLRQLKQEENQKNKRLKQKKEKQFLKRQKRKERKEKKKNMGKDEDI